MGDLPSNATFVNETGDEYLPGLDKYASGEALAAVHLFQGYQDWTLRFASACCMIFMLIGIPGNLITIVALARCKKVHNATALFIINLSISDLLFCCMELPMAATTFWEKSWVFGITMCRLFSMAKHGLIDVSLFSITAITINRYILISHPRLYKKIYTNRNLILIVMTIWLLSICLMIPIWLEVWGRFSLDPKIGCTIVKDIHNRSPKKYLYFIDIVIPGLTIIFCYARIFFIVRRVTKRSRSTYHMKRTALTDTTTIDINDAKSSTIVDDKANNHKLPCPEAAISQDKIEINQNSKHTMDKIRKEFLNHHRIGLNLPTKKDNKLRTMIVAIILVFFLCRLPISVMKIFFGFHNSLTIVSYMLCILMTCVNPIIYVVMSNEYRQAYKDLVTC